MSPRLMRILDDLVRLATMDAPPDQRASEAKYVLDELSDVHVSPEKVRALHERSGLGLHECRRALHEMDGDLAAAIKRYD